MDFIHNYDCEAQVKVVDGLANREKWEGCCKLSLGIRQDLHNMRHREIQAGVL